MFDRNKNKPSAEPPAPEPVAAPRASAAATTPNPAASRSIAMIGPGIHIKGTVTGDEDLLIQGKVEGTINLSDHEVVIGQSGKVTADIKAKTVKIDGEVTGDVSGIEKVVIAKSGRVRGNIVAPRVTLEDGAHFKGSIDMDPGDTRTAQAVPKIEKAVAAPANNANLGLDLKHG
jgi:cytoskeletal protein CcmA (bactofilin family)